MQPTMSQKHFGVQWEHRMDNDEVHCQAVSADRRPLTEVTALNRLRWFGHTFHMPTHGSAVVPRFGQSWRERRDDQVLT